MHNLTCRYAQINMSFDTFQMTKEQRDRVAYITNNTKNNDFKFIGSLTLMRHIIFNLLKNELYNMQTTFTRFFYMLLFKTWTIFRR